MPFELEENNINFGIENVTIKRTLNRIYDPYSGINLLPDYYSSCHHLEIMTLPSGSTDNLDYTLSCDNPLAIKNEVHRILDLTQKKCHIFNVGHGLIPEVKIRNVKYVIKLIDDYF